MTPAMPDFNELYRKYNVEMEDFWSRRANAPKYEKTIHVFGQRVVFDSNHEKVLESATFAEQMYSTWDSSNDSIWRVHLTVHDSNPMPAPERLVDLIQYAGAGDWFSIDLREWGNCFVDMERCEAHVILSSSLAENPEQVCQLSINTILNNFLTRHGYSMLHASALVKDGNILILQAPHGTGKSTTALRLLLHGYQLLSDSQIYLGEREGEIWMGGFPVGRIKLRSDMLPFFPVMAEVSKAEPVRNEIKHRVDLMRVDPAAAVRQMIPIQRVEYCLLERWDRPESQIGPLSEEELWPEIMVNSLHYDTPEIWRENLHRVDLMLQKANLHRLRIGTSETEILKTVNQLW
jgi:hypothetical protein